MSFKLKANIIIFEWHNIINLFKTSCNVVDLFMLTSILRFWLLGIEQDLSTSYWVFSLKLSLMQWSTLLILWSCTNLLSSLFHSLEQLGWRRKVSGNQRTTTLEADLNLSNFKVHSSLHIFFAVENTVNAITCILLFLILFLVPREMGFAANCLIVLNQWVFI